MRDEAVNQTPIQDEASFEILAPGRNCWRIEPAERVAFLIDAQDYYRNLRVALKAAKRSIMILGWDFDGNIALEPAPYGDGRKLSDILVDAVEANPELEICIFIWDRLIMYGPDFNVIQRFNESWLNHPQIHFRLDNNHPIGGCHHSKIVCIDDALAFVGGIDLTARRWDTRQHLPAEPGRLDVKERPYPPVHDVQMAVDGAAARAIAELARGFWQVASGTRLDAVEAQSDPWPVGLPSALTAPIAIARTVPLDGIREVEALNRDALAAARHCIYIEAQYFAAPGVGDILAEQLQKPDGPEVVAVVKRRTEGVFEGYVLGYNTQRTIRRLEKADRYDRLRIRFPLYREPEEAEIDVHAKIVLVDDKFVRIGSSNLNNRSIGLDSECDLAIEARDEATSAAIIVLRNELLAEHLGTKAEAVTAAIAETGSVVKALDRLNVEARGLNRFDVDPNGATEEIAGTALLDPSEPYDIEYLVQYLRWN